MGPTVEYVLNPETKEPDVLINGRPAREYDFSYNAFIGDIGLRDMLDDVLRRIFEVFRAPKV